MASSSESIERESESGPSSVSWRSTSESKERMLKKATNKIGKTDQSTAIKTNRTKSKGNPQKSTRRNDKDENRKFLSQTERVLINKIFNTLCATEEYYIAMDDPQSKTGREIKILSGYLERYFTLFEKTKGSLVQLISRRDAEIQLITKIFDRIRKELEAKEKQLKVQYKTLISSHETTLSLDYDYLSSKCISLCDTLDSIVQAKDSLLDNDIEDE